MVRAFALALPLGLVATWAESACRLALLLALDVSSSVDAAEHRLQRDGIAAALATPEVIAALLDTGPPVAIAAYEWSGRYKDNVIVDWTMVRGPDDIAGIQRRLATAPRSYDDFPTAMGYTLGFGATYLRDGPRCDRAVIDLSGDGVTNDGFGPTEAYRHYPFAEVTVNGLAVLGTDPQVQRYYQRQVLHGPGAFLETAQGYAGYRAAMTRKLIREIRPMVLGATGQTEYPG
ncbi:DUF1194 domain-containing protein [Pseudoprimorskyibacter insulae]|uniref:VWFA domain-containing protein n=1 Tax=Pseudoprimorskyibacter insulae TaxID=1695997 RepID=A0A2R8APQ1_9RHOB|nr:DUF1194 domain-containing protein [Pseudoprimorskyibacter insulae]SPF78058.1 hypothetical protein PRI8871_00647 [Pseudoprimorskyibacter insulae]